MQLLVIEAEKNTAEYLCKGLDEAGFSVDLARNGAEGHRLAMIKQVDLIIVDVLLPDISGWQIVNSLREQGRSIPILFLTTPDRVNSKIESLKPGIDDYLVKPFTVVELLFHVRTLLRHPPALRIAERLQFADLIIDLRRRRVTRGGKLIHLTYKEYSILELLVRRQGEVLPHSLIASQVWGMNVERKSNVIEVAIRRLRTKIDEPLGPKLIHTVRGMGYQLDILSSE